VKTSLISLIKNVTTPAPPGPPQQLTPIIPRTQKAEIGRMVI
jgi:hypothetical protein